MDVAQISDAHCSRSFDPVPNAHFCEERHCIMLNRLYVDPQLQSDFLICEALRQISEYLMLSCGQTDQIVGRK